MIYISDTVYDVYGNYYHVEFNSDTKEFRICILNQENNETEFNNIKTIQTHGND